MNLFSGVVESLQQGVTFALRRHAILAHNLANIETPGYQARDLTFSRELDLAQKSRAVPVSLAPAGQTERMAKSLDVSLVLSPDGPPRSDGNDVDIDRQMVKIGGNAGYHNVVVQLLVSRLNAMKMAITGRV
ncbi:MAG: flagellar basal body rod protein FlgB [Candidatus Methylomirabilia bacterium]